MAQSVQIVIVSLCTLLNVNGTDTTLPPPSVVIPRTNMLAHPHKGFFAWDTSKVDYTNSDGSVGLDINDTRSGTAKPTGFKYLELDGDLIEIVTPAPGALNTSGFTGIPNSKTEWGTALTATEWDPRYGPKGLGHNGPPDEAFVAGFMHLAGGALTTSRPTTVKWKFVKPNGTVVTNAACYNKEVNYRFDAQEQSGGKTRVTFTLKDLAGPGHVPDRTITFTAKTAGTDLEVFLGNDTLGGMFYDVMRCDSINQDGNHFLALHAMMHPGPNGTTGGQPRKTATVCQTAVACPAIAPFHPAVRSAKTKAAAAPHGGGDETGYCGPDGKP